MFDQQCPWQHACEGAKGVHGKKSRIGRKIATTINLDTTVVRGSVRQDAFLRILMKA